MEITQPQIQQEIAGQIQSQTSEKKWWLWLLIIIAALIAIWLGLAWLRGWFPFSFSRDTYPKIPQEVLNSLTATNISAEVSTTTIKGLTATSTTSSYSSSVLDSLTPNK